MHPKVSVVESGFKPKTIEKATFHLLDRLWGKRGVTLERSARILLKPNLTMDKPWDTGVTTCPYVVKALAEWFSSKLPSSEVIVGEGSMLGVETSRAFEACGYTEIAEELSLELLDLNLQPKARLEVPGGISAKEIEVAKPVLDADFLVDIAKLKTHILTLVTLGMKNLKGVLPPEGKRKLHLLGLDQGIVDLNTVVKPGLTVVEAVIGMEGLGPLVGDPIPVGLLIGGFGVVEVDAVSSYIMGVNPREVNHLAYAEERGLGTVNIAEIPVDGVPLEKARKTFKLPPRSLTEAYSGVEIVDGGACSGCIGALAAGLKIAWEKGELKQALEAYQKVKVLVGPRASTGRIEEGLTLICGRCLFKKRNLGVFIPGCPPQGYLIRDMLRIKLGLPPIYVGEELIREAEETYRET